MARSLNGFVRLQGDTNGTFNAQDFPVNMVLEDGDVDVDVVPDPIPPTKDFRMIWGDGDDSSGLFVTIKGRVLNNESDPKNAILLTLAGRLFNPNTESKQVDHREDVEVKLLAGEAGVIVFENVLHLAGGDQDAKGDVFYKNLSNTGV